MKLNFKFDRNDALIRTIEYQIPFERHCLSQEQVDEMLQTMSICEAAEKARQICGQGNSDPRP